MMSPFSPFSWIVRRSISFSSSAAENENSSNAKGGSLNEEELGVTEELRAFVRGFTADTFRAHQISRSQDVPSSCRCDGDRVSLEGDDPNRGTVVVVNVLQHLTDWQERHAVLVLSTVKEIAQLRYALCPRHMKENQFWGIYFLLVKNLISPYELLAIRKEKLKKMEQGDNKSHNGSIEVEMTETKPGKGISS